MEKLLTVAEVAEVLGVPVKTIYNWRAQAVPYGPPAARVGNRLRFRPSDVDAWLRRNTTGEVA